MKVINMLVQILEESQMDATLSCFRMDEAPILDFTIC